jgi:predicted HicB family RNase H-like nuclease
MSTKTETLMIRLSPQLKRAAQRAAQQDHRSMTSLIEHLIANHCAQHGVPMRDEKDDEVHNQNEQRG